MKCQFPSFIDFLCEILQMLEPYLVKKKRQILLVSLVVLACTLSYANTTNAEPFPKVCVSVLEKSRRKWTICPHDLVAAFFFPSAHISDDPLINVED